MIDPLALRPDVAWFCCVSELPDASEARASLYTTAADQTDPELHIVPVPLPARVYRSEEHTSELQSLRHLVCRLLLEKKTFGVQGWVGDTVDDPVSASSAGLVGW